MTDEALSSEGALLSRFATIYLCIGFISVALYIVEHTTTHKMEV
jgi:hypothetical protein